MLQVKETNKFRRDKKLMHRRGRNLEKLAKIVQSLAFRQSLDPRHRPHGSPATGSRSGNAI